MHRPTTFRNLAQLMSAVALAAAGLTAALNEVPGRFPVPADHLTYFGIQLDSEFDTVGAYAARLGSTPALYGRYVHVPLASADEASISKEVRDLADRDSSLMLTLEPRRDLGAVTPQSLTDLTRDLTA